MAQDTAAHSYCAPTPKSVTQIARAGEPAGVLVRRAHAHATKDECCLGTISGTLRFVRASADLFRRGADFGDDIVRARKVRASSKPARSMCRAARPNGSARAAHGPEILASHPLKLP